MMSQILGLDHDLEVIEDMVGFFLHFYDTEEQEEYKTISFEDFLVDVMHIQLVNFEQIRRFRHYSYLLQIILSTNLTKLQQNDPFTFADLSFITGENSEMDAFTFINKVKSCIFELIHEEKLPRVIEELRSLLQLTKSKAMGDWFFYEEETIIRVYGFLHQPYILPAFLTPRILCLEYAKQKIIYEDFHFENAHKASDLKLPVSLGPFILKNRSFLPAIETTLAQYQFKCAR